MITSIDATRLIPGFRRLTSRALLTCACLGLTPGLTTNAAASQQVTALSDTVVNARADTLLAAMTDEEKAGQLTDYFYFGQLFAPMAKPVEAAVASGHAGALLFVTDPATINRVQKIAVEQTRMKIPLLFGFDVIHGLRTIFPVPLGMAASWDPTLVEQGQATAAAEARAVGLHWAFAPMVDIARDPRWGRIIEGAGEDPYLGSAMAAAQVRGFQGGYIGAPGQIIAGPKHFAGYGAAIGGRDYEESDISDNQLWNVYFPPFKAAVDAGAGNIMSAYMPLNGVPATGNAWLLTDVLRKKWGFKGFVVSDSGAVHSLTTHGLTKSDTEAAERAFLAGANMEMVPPGQKADMQAIPAAIAAGRITAAQLNDAVRPILGMKIRMGLFERPYVDVPRAEVVLNDPAHRALARTAAERTAVLLKNEGRVMPLNRASIKSIALIGPLANSARDIMGSWVFPMNKPHADSILAGLRTKLGTLARIDYAQGVQMPLRLNPSPFARLDGTPAVLPPIDETAEIAKAVSLARRSDVAILVLGEAAQMSGELASRASLDLPGRQQELLDAVVASGRPVVVVLLSARPLSLHDTKAAAILDIWYPGSEGAAATANLLFGDATPGGKLPISWIRSAAQAPSPYAHDITHDPTNASKRYWDTMNDPTYPFGYGLSYTSFAYAALKVETPSVAPGQPVRVSVDLTNTGERAGDEVAQLYIHQRSGTSVRPMRELKGFQRVALRPGETRTLHFTLQPEDLRYWSAVNRDWVADSSDFDVGIGGSSSADLSAHFTVTAP
jgi:beta-glucosidase